jgi:predicted regulator of Ras-like GTPase activity (Roadblock/LC7/MglB family)
MAQTADALAHLTEISTQIECAVVLDREGTVLGATIEDDERAGRLAGKALALFRAADEQSPRELVQLDVALRDGTVFVVRDGNRLIAAATGPQPTVGLVFYDLKSCLRGFGEPAAKPKPKRAAPKRTTTRKKKDASA